MTFLRSTSIQTNATDVKERERERKMRKREKSHTDRRKILWVVTHTSKRSDTAKGDFVISDVKESEREKIDLLTRTRRS